MAKLWINVFDYGGKIAFTKSQDVNGTDYDAAMLKLSKAVGREWPNHFAGTESDARLFAAFVLGIRAAGGKASGVRYHGFEITAGVSE